jgi:hypothetical protein
MSLLVRHRTTTKGTTMNAETAAHREVPALRDEINRVYTLETRRTPVDGSWQAWLTIDGKEWEASGPHESRAVVNVIGKAIR